MKASGGATRRCEAEVRPATSAQLDGLGLGIGERVWRGLAIGGRDPHVAGRRAEQRAA